MRMYCRKSILKRGKCLIREVEVESCPSRNSPDTKGSQQVAQRTDLRGKKLNVVKCKTQIFSFWEIWSGLKIFLKAFNYNHNIWGIWADGLPVWGFRFDPALLFKQKTLRTGFNARQTKSEPSPTKPWVPLSEPLLTGKVFYVCICI